MMLRNTFSLVIDCLLLWNGANAFNITFRVDMNNVTANFITPQVNGTFNNWCGACFSMTDADGDNIWEGTTNLAAGTYQYKFAYDNWTGQETLTPGTPCTVTSGSFTNRSLVVTSDAVLPIVCWNSCASCADTPPPPAFYSVTFSLDMSEQTGFGIPEVNGIFNNWCGNCFPMIDSNNDSIYTATTTLQEGAYEYKFSYSNWSGQETLTSGSPCTQTTDAFTNRVLNLSSDTVLSPVCWASCYGCGLEPQEYNVTFRVDMSEQSGFTIPEVNGTFNGWCGNCNPMSDLDNDSIWELTIPLLEGMLEYKFSFDNWTGQEYLDSGSFCTVSSDGFTNRYLNLSSDTVLNIVCFGSCNECGYVAPPTPTYNVTFQLDMSQQSRFTAPEINGSFNNFCGNCNPLSDSIGNGIWSVTLQLTEGEYAFYYSTDSLTSFESFDSNAICVENFDSAYYRWITIYSDTVLPVLCWGECVACAVTPVYYDITFQVDMNGQTGFTTPELNGTFNGWCGSCSPMSDADGDNVWTITVPLQAATYEYKFSYDSLTGQETLITGMTCTQTSPEGFVSRVVTVDGETDLGVVCWESCNACNVVVLNQMNLPVTFDDDQVEYGIIGFDGSENSAVEVDPTNAANRVTRVTKSASAGASSGVTITAPAELGFSNAIPFTADATTMSVRVWSPDAGIQVRLKVEDHNDPTHSVETNVNTTVANDWEVLVFDFSNQSSGTAALNLSYSYDKASIFFNFGVDGATAGEKTYYFDDVVFGGQVIVATQYNVTFQVDMQNVSGFTIPEVNGSFNGWCGGCFALTDIDGDGIWIGTAAIDEGVHEYKFAYDAWTGQENLLPGLPCTVTNFGFTNRSLNVTGDVVLPVVCWESCGDCLAAPVNHEVTFQVDMNGVVGFTTPEVNGTFNNWCGSCFPMTDTDGDNIWEATTTLAVGSYEYKYSYDNWSGSEQLTEGSNCTVTNSGFTNRILNLDSDTVLNVVCWSSCTSCDSTPPPPVMHNVTFRVDMSQQVGFTTPEVNGSFNNWCGSCFPMTDTDGDNIWEATTMLAEGQYEYKFSNDNWTGQESLTAG